MKSPTLFQQWLKAHHACTSARRWVGRKRPRVAWLTCSKPAWMHWFLLSTGLWTVRMLDAETPAGIRRAAGYRVPYIRRAKGQVIIVWRQTHRPGA